jgi:hypothetical protein
VGTTLLYPSAQQFMEMLFGKRPELFKDEDELRALWSAPDTRARLLQGLAEAGFGRDQMAEMQRIIDAERSDLFDVLAHVARGNSTCLLGIPEVSPPAGRSSAGICASPPLRTSPVPFVR